MRRLFAWVAVVALATLGAPIIGMASASAGGGNSANAHTCQHHGWQNQVTVDGTAFTNQGDCVSYAAHGGQFGNPCLDSTTSYMDVRLTGPLNTEIYTAEYVSTDGTCSGGTYTYLTTVEAATSSDALIYGCEPLGYLNVVSYASRGYSTAPGDWWICIVG